METHLYPKTNIHFSERHFQDKYFWDVLGKDLMRQISFIISLVLFA